MNQPLPPLEGDEPASRAEDLAGLRARMDEVDRALLDLLNERADLVETIFRHKRARGDALYDGLRVLEVLERLRPRAGDALGNDAVERLYAHVMDYFGLEFAGDRFTRPGHVRLPERLAQIPRPWIVVDDAEGSSVEGSNRERERAAGLLRMGQGDAADLVEVEGLSGAFADAPRPLVFRRPHGARLGPWLRRVATEAARAGEVHALLLVPAGEKDARRRLHVRTDHPVLVDARDAGQADAAWAALEEGLDGLVVGSTGSSPQALAAMVERARGLAVAPRAAPGGGARPRDATRVPPSPD